MTFFLEDQVSALCFEKKQKALFVDFLCCYFANGDEFVVFGLALIVAGIVTRRPLVLQLHKTDDGTQEYAEFLHIPRRKFSDFGV